MKCCEAYGAALSAFVDGELDEQERGELLAHVEHCPNCRDALSELMILHTMFEELPELDAPDGFAERVLDRVHAEERAKKRSRRAWPRVLAACFALVVISAAALKILPAMTSKSDSAANEAADNSSAMDDAAGGAANDGYSYTYAAVQRTARSLTRTSSTKACRRTAPLTVPPTRTAITPSSRSVCPRRQISCESTAWLYMPRRRIV